MAHTDTIVKDTALKQALTRRADAGGKLPSNFTYRMMDRVRFEVQKQEKRERTMTWLVPAITSFLLIISAAFVIMYRTEVKLSSISMPESALTPFYVYVAVLILFLLGLDYGFRHYRKT